MGMERKRETQRERAAEEEEQHVLWRSFKSLLWGKSFQASSGQSPCLFGFVLTQGPALRMDFSTEVSGRLTGSAKFWCPSFFRTGGNFL